LVGKNKRILILAILLTVVITTICLFLGSIFSIQSSNTQPNGPVSTDEQAIKIAIPLAKTCAKEKNYTITTPKATFRESTRPYWVVEIEFKTIENKDQQSPSILIFDLNQQSSIFNATKDENYQNPSYLYTYEVTIWADTGEIYHHGIMTFRTLHDDLNDVEEFGISVDQAFELALPFVQVYAQENNRTITTNVCIYAGYVNSRPTWIIEMNFETINDKQKHDVQYYIYGYAVLIWGDTGEIRDHGVQGNM